MKRSLKIKLAASFLSAAVLTALAASGLLYTADNRLADDMYQRPSGTGGEIAVIGMDQRALEEIGPLPWSREFMAEIIERLNADEDRRPAVIGVDVLYTSPGDTAADARLVEAVEEGGNVVMASSAVFDTALKEGKSGFYLDDYAVTAYDAPFPALAEVAAGVGHINAMYDNDGVLRHSILWIDRGDGARVDSFARVIYEKYMLTVGVEAAQPPQTDSRGRWYLPFTAEPGGYYDGVSVADVLRGELEADYFTGRIVLIGPYAAGMQDAYVTAVDRAEQMYGVEFQANTIQAFLDGRVLRESGDGWQLALLFLLSGLALLFFFDRKVLPATLLWLSGVGGWLGLCLALALGGGVLLHPLYIPLSLSVLYVVTVAVNYVRSLLENRRITGTFRRYVDPSVIHELLREGSDSLGLGGKLCDIAVLFVDIRGFTPLSEDLPPSDVVEILNRYLSLTTRCVMDNHGTLDKFVGDCTMAIWNAPLPCEDYVMQACRTALDMVEGSKALGDELLSRFGRSVSFGVGVHCGKAVVGNIGAKMRMDYTAIGDTVNTASRLEANAPPGKVYISRAVADALKGRIAVTSFGGSIKLKGKTDGFEVLTLDGLTETGKGVELP